MSCNLLAGVGIPMIKIEDINTGAKPRLTVLLSL